MRVQPRKTEVQQLHLIPRLSSQGLRPQTGDQGRTWRRQRSSVSQPDESAVAQATASGSKIGESRLDDDGAAGGLLVSRNPYHRRVDGAVLLRKYAARNPGLARATSGV